MFIRYVVGRPTPPQPPKILKAGGVSVDVRADTSLELYLRACTAEQVEPDAGYVHHLEARDAIAWQYRLDIFASGEMIRAALADAAHTQTEIGKARRTADGVPARNAWNCTQCSWASHCEGDPLAANVAEWHGVGHGKPASPISVLSQRTRLDLNRERLGFVCSPSELRAYLFCPRRHWLEYVQRLTPGAEGMKALSRVVGQLVHELIRIKTLNPAVNLHTEAQVLAHEVSAAGDLSPDAAQALADPRQVEAMADRAAGMLRLAMDGVAEVLEVEQRRALCLPGTKRWLHGIPDAVVRLDDGRVGLIEYKTTMSSRDLVKVADRYRTSPQPHLYAALVRSGATTLENQP